jgi:hypothetical protein
MTKEEIRKRNRVIALTAIYEPEVSLLEIANKYGITKQRVSLILKVQDVDRRIIKQRKANREQSYQEALREAKIKREATTLPGGKVRPEYRVYRNMMSRCCNPLTPAYKNYGGRGIDVCDRWIGKFGFDNFIEDMGPRPEGTYANGRAKHSIHRKDNDGNYEPTNCKWATQTEQCANRRKSQRKAVGHESALEPTELVCILYDNQQWIPPSAHQSVSEVRAT